ncbi:c-type cytochrome [Spirulina sp. CS-785/01]|uniref:cytochrome c6 PetJ n=1 Tax=Spirulina sp. CS-785/01 TaxID=3021716 RepID=UPI00232CB5C6|nr:c-type cytochrome [Spirulina sp. CS-785/01]MDB9312421.1 c-type cytochrome [Spirulina sp. CS-785/01]
MLKRLALVFVCILTVTTLLFSSPAKAEGDISRGKQIFAANCAQCHMGGKNVVIPTKTLSKADLEKYNMDSLEAITTQVKNGKSAMPAFLGKLDEQDIEDVATYVLAQAEKGW